jgi:hypothetical protein
MVSERPHGGAHKTKLPAPQNKSKTRVTLSLCSIIFKPKSLIGATGEDHDCGCL